jgi:hypothetical protein
MVADVEKPYHDPFNTPFRAFVQRDALGGPCAIGKWGW